MEANVIRSGLGWGLSSRRGVYRQSDERLVSATQRGSAAAAEELIKRYWDTAYRAAYLIGGDLHAAEEVAQEAMIKALKSLRDFDGSRPFGPWIYRIAANRCIDLLRSNEREFSTNDPQIFERPAFQPADSDLDPRLAGALQRLESEDRAAVIMRYVLDLRASEIGEMLGLSEAGTRTRLHRAMRAIREQMEVGP